MIYGPAQILTPQLLGTVENFSGSAKIFLNKNLYAQQAFIIHRSNLPIFYVLNMIPGAYNISLNFSANVPYKDISFFAATESRVYNWPAIERNFNYNLIAVYQNPGEFVFGISGFPV